MMVDVKFVKKFNDIVSLDTIETTPGLEQMLVIKKGMRLSIQPVTKSEYDIVTAQLHNITHRLTRCMHSLNMDNLHLIHRLA